MVLGACLVIPGEADQNNAVVVIKGLESDAVKWRKCYQESSDLLAKFGLGLAVFTGEFGFQAQDSADPKNPDYYPVVECGASIGPDPYAGASLRALMRSYHG